MVYYNRSRSIRGLTAIVEMRMSAVVCVLILKYLLFYKLGFMIDTVVFLLSE